MIILRRMVIESNFIWRLSIKWTTRLIATSVLQKFGTSRFSSTNLPHQAPLDALRPCSNGLHCGSSSVTVPVILKDGMPLNVFCSTLEMSRIANVQVAKETSTRQFEKHIEWHAMKSQFGVVVEFLIHVSWPPDQVTGGQKTICCNYHNSTRAFKVPLLPPGVQEMKFGKSMEEPTCRILKRIETTQTICNMRVDYECTVQQLHILSFRCNYSLSNVPVNTDVIHHLPLLPALFGMLALIAMIFFVAT